MDMNLFTERVVEECGKFAVVVPVAWDSCLLPTKREFLTSLLIDFTDIPDIRELKEEICSHSGGLAGLEKVRGEMSNTKFDELPMTLWPFIKLAFDAKMITFSGKLLRERLNLIYAPARGKEIV